MIQYEIGNGINIKQLDTNNWIISEERIRDKGINAGEKYDFVHGYYPSLQSCIRGASDKVTNIAKTHKQLMEFLEAINKIKK